MGILQSLFGMPQGGMDTSQPMGLVQNILSQRFQSQPQDIAQAISMSGTSGSSVSPETVAAQRLAPVMEIAKTLGTLNQSSLEIAKLNELMRHDRATELQNPFNQPITESPTTIDGGQSPSQSVPAQNIPTMMQNNATPQPMTSIPQAMQNNAIDNRPASPQREANALSALIGGAGDRISDTSMAQPAEMDATRQQAGPMDNAAYASGSAKSKLTPLYKGNVPYDDGLEKGYQWAQAPDGSKVAMQIPGTIQKGANGEILTSDPSGNVTQQVPPNPMMKQKFEQNITKIAGLFDELNKAGGSVEAGADWKTNKLNQLAGTKGIDLLGHTVIPGGQTIMEGTETQRIRGQIQDLIKQTTPLYMQAMGITPGMERAVSAQQMLMDALGGNVGKSRQENLYSIANLSQQAGTGEFAKRYQSQPQGTTQTDNQAGQRVNIITPDGKAGTIDAAHVDDLLAAGGKLAQ